jgi:hypothetical protein
LPFVQKIFSHHQIFSFFLKKIRRRRFFKNEEKRDDDDFGGFFEQRDDGSGTRDRANAGRVHSEKRSRRRLRRDDEQFWSIEEP